MSRRGYLSPLELVLWGDTAENVRVLGSNCPPRMLPADAGKRNSTSGNVDIGILAPTVAECRQSGWLARAIAELSSAHLVYALVPRAWRWSARHLLRSAGLQVTTAFLHTPDHCSDHHYIVPLRRQQARFALSSFVPTTPWKRSILTRILSRSAGPTLASYMLPRVGLLATRRCQEHGAASGDIEVPLHAQPTSIHFDAQHATAVVMQFAGESDAPKQIAKLPLDQPVIDRTVEARSLALFGRAAQRAGAHVPGVLGVRQVGSQNVLFETPVRGRPLAELLRRQPDQYTNVMDRVVDWLENWNCQTAAVHALSAEWLQAQVLAPLEQVRPLLANADAYLHWISRQCDAQLRHQVPWVAVHNDLAAGNVLLDDVGRLAVVDWEMARGADLPLLDFVYLVTETAASLSGYASWLDAFESGFGSGGRFRSWVRARQQRLQQALGVSDEFAEFAMHVCWIRRIARDLHQPRRAGDLPFLPILQRLASAAAVVG